MCPMDHQRVPFLAQASQQGPLPLLSLRPLLLHLAFPDGSAGHLARRRSLGARAGLDGGLVQRNAADVEHGGGGQELDHLRVKQALNGLVVDVRDQVPGPQPCLKRWAVH